MVSTVSRPVQGAERLSPLGAIDKDSKLRREEAGSGCDSGLYVWRLARPASTRSGPRDILALIS